MSDRSAKLLLPHPYVDDLINEINRAHSRVIIFSHIIANDTATSKLIDALCKAAQRGLAVHVAGDIYTFGIFRAWEVSNKSLKKLREMRKRFKKSGVKYRWIGNFGPFLYSGRTHVKWSLVDDTVYTFGGVNLYRAGLAAHDYTIRTIDSKLANYIEAEHVRILRADIFGSFYRSHEFKCDIGTALFDGGFLFDSRIYRRACELAAQASEVLFVSQYCPTGKLGRIMATKNARLYFSRPELAEAANRFLIRTSMRRTGYKTLYTRDVYIHAKFMIFTMPDGSKAALTGSHNFVWGGVVLGTREIDLETSDASLIAQLEQFFVDHIS